MGEPFTANTLSNPYGSKLNELAELTGGDDSPFGLILKLAQPDIRNAIAHGSIWVVPDEGKVRYTEKGQTHELDLADFLLYGIVGSHLAKFYLVAVCALVVLEVGTAAEKAQIPDRLSRVYYHTTTVDGASTSAPSP
jgi:hypothetical protein